MRDMAIKMMRSIGDFAGGCNVQFAVSPDENEDIIAIEINLGAALALKIQGDGVPHRESGGQVGHWVPPRRAQEPNWQHQVMFEPTLDYVVKIPR